MSAKFVYELFLDRINSKNSPENFIEVFDCYDSRYGGIFYKGKLIDSFYKQSYSEVVRDYAVIAEMVKKGLNIKKAEVIVYHLEPLREYQDDMTTMDFESATDYSYKELLGGFKKDLESINNAIKLEESNRYYKFISNYKL